MEFFQVMSFAILIVGALILTVIIIAYIIYLNIDRRRWKSTAIQYRKINDNYKRSSEQNLLKKALLFEKRFRVINTEPVEKKAII